MALEQKLNLRLSQRLVMTPSLQQAIKLLQMSKLELLETITQEIVENPLLEDDQEEPAETDQAEAPQASAELAAVAAEAAPADAATAEERDSFEEIDFNSFFEDYLDTGYNPRQYAEEGEAAPLENTLTRTQDLQEYLNWQLGMSRRSRPTSSATSTRTATCGRPGRRSGPPGTRRRRRWRPRWPSSEASTRRASAPSTCPTA